MRGLISFLILPLSIFWILLILSAIFLLFKKKTSAKQLLVSAIIWFLIVSTGFIPRSLARGLESRYKQFTLSGNEKTWNGSNVIVLGAGFSDDPDLISNNKLSPSALVRLIEGIRIFNSITDKNVTDKASLPFLIVSGFNSGLKTSQAEVLSKTAIMLGIDSARVKMLVNPRNTRQEALEYYKVCGNTVPIIIVTDAIHMRRSLLLFKKAGLNATPAPTNYFIKNSTLKYPWAWLPSSDNIHIMEAVTHEYTGILWTLLGGK
jgi:uncharacterized SAM-binding protein YcdF (DUF218 family)